MKDIQHCNVLYWVVVPQAYQRVGLELGFVCLFELSLISCGFDTFDGSVSMEGATTRRLSSVERERERERERESGCQIQYPCNT